MIKRMTIDDLIAEIRQYMNELGITTPEERAFLLATAHQECGSFPSTLVTKFNNIYGVKFRRPNDITRYQPVTFRGNRFDAISGAAWVEYRTYVSRKEAVRIEHANKFKDPKLYAPLRSKYAPRYPSAPIDWVKWLPAIARVHCQNNPEHVESVMRLFSRYLAEERA